MTTNDDWSGEQGDLVAYLSIGAGIPVKVTTGRYVRAEPDVDWPEASRI